MTFTVTMSENSLGEYKAEIFKDLPNDKKELVASAISDEREKAIGNVIEEYYRLTSREFDFVEDIEVDEDDYNNEE